MIKFCNEKQKQKQEEKTIRVEELTAKVSQVIGGYERKEVIPCLQRMLENTLNANNNQPVKTKIIVMIRETPVNIRR